jgi:hypothetical protein
MRQPQVPTGGQTEDLLQMPTGILLQCGLSARRLASAQGSMQSAVKIVRVIGLVATVTTYTASHPRCLAMNYVDDFEFKFK